MKGSAGQRYWLIDEAMRLARSTAPFSKQPGTGVDVTFPKRTRTVRRDSSLTVPENGT